MDSASANSNIQIILNNQDEWGQSETILAMSVTKEGRTLWPGAFFSVRGLDPGKMYAMSVHFVLFDNFCYISRNSVYEPYREDFSAPNETTVLLHPQVKSGKEWMASFFTFYELKLVNKASNDPNKILVHLKHRYKLVLSVYEMLLDGNLKLAAFCQFDCANFIATGTKICRRNFNINKPIREHVFENSAMQSEQCSEQCKKLDPLPLPQLASPINPLLGNNFNANLFQPNPLLPQLVPSCNPFFGNRFNTNLFQPNPLLLQLALPFNPFFGNRFNANFLQPTQPLPQFASNPVIGSNSFGSSTQMPAPE